MLWFFFFASCLCFDLYSLFFMFWFFWQWGMWDLSSLTRDGACTRCVGKGKESLNHWTARESPSFSLKDRLGRSYRFNLIIHELGSIPSNKWRRKCNPLQYSCLENPRYRGAWWVAVYGAAQSQTWLKRRRCSSHPTNRSSLCEAVQSGRFL